MTEGQYQAQEAPQEPQCDHICLLAERHVDEGRPHFYGYRLGPSSPSGLQAEVQRLEADVAARDAVIEQIRALHPSHRVTFSDGSHVMVCANHGYCDTERILSSLPSTGEPPSVIDAAHLAHQREWSERTFGPGRRTLGVTDHIRKELREIEDDPTDLSEWVDVAILALDGAWRAGHEPQQIIDAIKAKQARNEARTWPDWRTMSEDIAIEHERQAAPASTGETK